MLPFIASLKNNHCLIAILLLDFLLMLKSCELTPGTTAEGHTAKQHIEARQLDCIGNGEDAGAAFGTKI